MKLPLSASALPHFQPLKDRSEGYLEERGLAGGWVCTSLLPFHWVGGTAASLHLQASQKDFKGSVPCTCKCLGKCKDGSEKWGPMQPCPWRQWDKGVWFPWTWWGSWAGQTSWSLLERDPTQESCLGRADKRTQRREMDRWKTRGWGLLQALPQHTHPNLTLKTTRISKYKCKVAVYIWISGKQWMGSSYVFSVTYNISNRDTL